MVLSEYFMARASLTRGPLTAWSPGSLQIFVPSIVAAEAARTMLSMATWSLPGVWSSVCASTVASVYGLKDEPAGWPRWLA